MKAVLSFVSILSLEKKNQNLLRMRNDKEIARIGRDSTQCSMLLQGSQEVNSLQHASRCYLFSGHWWYCQSLSFGFVLLNIVSQKWVSGSFAFHKQLEGICKVNIALCPEDLDYVLGQTPIYEYWWPRCLQWIGIRLVRKESISEYYDSCIYRFQCLHLSIPQISEVENKAKNKSRVGAIAISCTWERHYLHHL